MKIRYLVIYLLIATILIVDSAISQLPSGSVPVGAQPGDQNPKLCVYNREIFLDGINDCGYRTGTYAFIGEQIRFDLMVRDPNGAEDIGYVKMKVADGAEVLCDETASAGNGDPDTIYNAIIDGADRLVDTQNTDGGWPWYVTGSSTVNTLGVTAQGVLSAYKLNPKLSYETSLDNAYDYMLNDPDVDSCPDFTFMVELSEVTGDSKYADLAKQRYDSKITSYGSAEAFAAYIRDARESQGYDGLVPWDIDLCVKGALALDRYYPGEGYGQDAEDMTEIIYNSMYTGTPIFDPEDSSEESYILGLSGALDSFRATGMFSGKMNSLVQKLVSYQDLDGSWPYSDGYPEDIQSTAYASLEMMKVGKVSNTQAGVQWLLDQQLATGGWNDPENNEVTGEVIDALFSLFYEIGHCNGLGSFNPETDKYYTCLLTVEPPIIEPPNGFTDWYGEETVKITVYNSFDEETDGTHTELWFFNPSLSLEVDTNDRNPITFESGNPGECVHSINNLVAKNTAEGGVNMWMYLSGTDLYDPNGASKCPTTNKIDIEDYMWFNGWSGTQWTEDWRQMSEEDENDNCDMVCGTPLDEKTCYGGVPVPKPGENVLTNQGTMQVEFKLCYPIPCIGTFSKGDIIVFGKVI